MADEAAKISVAVEVELEKLRAGLAAAQANVAASSSQMESSVKKFAANAGKELETFAKRANILLGIQGAVSGVRALEAATALARGEFEQAYAAAERLPMGIGALATAIRELGMEWAGVNEAIRESEAIMGRMNEENAARAANAKAISDNEAKAAEIAAERETDLTKRRDILIAEAERKAKEAQRSAVSAGVDPAVAARAYELDIAKSIEEINKRIQADAERASNKALEDARRKHQNEMDDAKRKAEYEAEQREKERREQLDAIKAEIEARKQAIDQLEPQLRAAQGVTGGNFISSVSTSLGQFRIAQGGGAESVARAQIRAADLLDKIRQTNEEMLELEKERDFVSSLR